MQQESASTPAICIMAESAERAEQPGTFLAGTMQTRERVLSPDRRGWEALEPQQGQGPEPGQGSVEVAGCQASQAPAWQAGSLASVGAQTLGAGSWSGPAWGAGSWSSPAWGARLASGMLPLLPRALLAGAWGSQPARISTIVRICATAVEQYTGTASSKLTICAAYST